MNEGLVAVELGDSLRVISVGRDVVGLSNGIIESTIEVNCHQLVDGVSLRGLSGGEV